MTRFFWRVAILSALSFAALAQEVRHPFKSFEVVDQDVKNGPVFAFSEGYATSESPIMITATGRKLTNADRTNRVDLQKHWLSVNVPDSFELQDRSLVKCGLKRKGEYPFCDLYVFIDPATNANHEYYIYVGNWP